MDFTFNDIRTTSKVENGLKSCYSSWNEITTFTVHASIVSMSRRVLQPTVKRLFVVALVTGLAWKAKFHSSKPSSNIKSKRCTRFHQIKVVLSWNNSLTVQTSLTTKHGTMSVGFTRSHENLAWLGNNNSTSSTSHNNQRVKIGAPLNLFKQSKPTSEGSLVYLGLSDSFTRIHCLVPMKSWKVPWWLKKGWMVLTNREKVEGVREWQGGHSA